MKNNWIRFLAGALRAVTPYTPGEQPRGVETLIKLNTNENPYPPSPKVLEALNGRAAENLRLYSDPACADFLAALAETFGVGRDQVFAGNGSDEVLAAFTRCSRSCSASRRRRCRSGRIFR